MKVVTLYDENLKSLSELSLPNKIEYTTLHQHDFIAHYGSLDASRPTSWSKIKLVQECLAGTDWLLWIDIDSFFTNFDRSIEGFIDEDFHLIIPTDTGKEPGWPANKSHKPRINASIFIIKNSPEMHCFLQQIYNLTQFINHFWWEQRAMMHILDTHPEYAGKVKCNAALKSGSSLWKPKDFTIHFGGKNKLPRVKKWLTNN